VEGHVDAGGHSRAGDDVAVVDVPVARTSIVSSMAASFPAKSRCVVAGRPFNNPAAASTSEPVHKLASSTP
jgi:hypothetical protein